MGRYKWGYKQGSYTYNPCLGTYNPSYNFQVIPKPWLNRKASYNISARDRVTPGPVSSVRTAYHMGVSEDKGYLILRSL